MKIARRTGGGRGVYELAAVQDLDFSPGQLLGKHLVLILAGGLLVPTGIEYTNQGGKPRLIIAGAVDESNGRAIHIHRQIAALLLLPKPTRSDVSVGAGAPVLMDDAYFLEEASIDGASIKGDDLLVSIRDIVVSNSDSSERIRFLPRFASVTRAWSEAESYPERTRELLLEHRNHVMSGAPLGINTEHLLAELLVSIDSQLPSGSQSTQRMDPRAALTLMSESAPLLRDEAILLLDFFLRVGSKIAPDSAAVTTMAGLLTRLAKMNGVRTTRSASDVVGALRDLDEATVGSADNELMFTVRGTFAGDRATLSAVASAIRRDVQLQDAPAVVPEDDELAFAEGRQLYRRHQQRERSSTAVRMKKANALRTQGHLVCEACGFEFGTVYHELGDGYIECHHNVPVSEYAAETRTRLEDLSLVCANCHRILHRRRPWMTAPELRDYLSGAG